MISIPEIRGALHSPDPLAETGGKEKLDALQEWAWRWGQDATGSQDFPETLELALRHENSSVRNTALRCAVEAPKALELFATPISRADLIRKRMGDPSFHVRTLACASLIRYASEFEDLAEQLHFVLAHNFVFARELGSLKDHLSVEEKASLITTFWEHTGDTEHPGVDIWEILADTQTLAHIIGMKEISPVIQWKAGEKLRELNPTRADQLAYARVQ